MQPVKPYSAEGSKKEQVAHMFNAISKRYDVLNRTLSLGIDVLWRKKTVRAVRQTGAVDILDVATGTADLAIALHRGIAGSRVQGVDISAGMLEVGREKITRRGLDPHIPLHLGDGESLPFEAASFDAVTVAFGVRNFEHLEKGLVDMGRALRPGGCLAVLEFSQPESFPFRQIYFFYFKYILPTIGRERIRIKPLTFGIASLYVAHTPSKS
ncbi:MAG: ubiquinone/menaquinone biosynthesis methyltransferase [Flavobacteriia bacterium]|nr:ubiquinone/menaquinone biosynthesis methyltransferase [Flavobacteriia bacterium]